MLGDNKSLSNVPMDIDTGKNSKEKIPDCLVDSCRRLSVNRMAVCLRSRHGIFVLSTNFSNTPYLTLTSLSYLETRIDLSTCAVKQ